MKYCPYCGNALDDDMGFCPKCGKAYKRTATIGESTAKEEEKTSEINREPSLQEKPTKDFSERANRKQRKWIKRIILLLILIAIAVICMLYSKQLDENEEVDSLPALTPTPTATSILDNSKQLDNLSKSVVMLECYDIDGNLYSMGSGFIAWRDNLVATNFHVINEDTYSINVLFENGDSIPATYVFAYNSDVDVAILELDRSSKCTPLSIGNTYYLERGDKVVAIGSPLGLINSISDGIVSGFLSDDIKTIQFTAAISPGSSGGALLNESGEVIGITYASFEEGQNLNLAIPIVVANKIFYNKWFSGDRDSKLTIEEFYNSFEHAQRFDFDYVIDHCIELNGKEIIVSAYVSSTDVSYYGEDYSVTYYLVGYADDIFWINSDGTNYDDLDVERERNQSYQSIRVVLSYDYDNDYQNELYTNPISPGKRITLKGKLHYYKVFIDKPLGVNFLALDDAELVK